MREPHLPEDLRYDLAHLWVRADGETAQVGLTDVARRLWGEAGFVQLPRRGSLIRAGDAVGQVSCALAGPCDLVAPISGRVTAVNDILAEEPTLIDTDPYGEGWLLNVEMSDPAELRDLMDAGAYRQAVEQPAPANVRAAIAGVFDHSIDAMILIDRHRRILAMNAAAERLTGYVADDPSSLPRCYHLFRCQAAWGMVHGVDCAAVCTRDTAHPGCRSEYTITRKDGAAIPVSATYSPIPQPGGEELFLLISLREIRKDQG